MVEYADLNGRFRFAPLSLDRDGGERDIQPYIDRLEVKSDYLYFPQISRDDLSQLVGHLQRDSTDLFNIPHFNKLTIKSGWLFGGEVSFRTPNDIRAGGIELSITLQLNPTRFLQAHRAFTDVAVVLAQQGAPDAALRSTQSYSRTLLETLQEARDLTFKQNDDNYLTHRPSSYGFIADWDCRLQHYWEIVVSLLEQRVVRAAGRFGSRSASIRQGSFQRLEWRVQQLEHYWEFAVPNAIEKVALVANTFNQVTRNAITRRFNSEPVGETGVEQLSTYVKGEYVHRKRIAKLYAKASGVVRFEFQYLNNPFSEAAGNDQSIPTHLKGSGDLDHVVRALMALGRHSWGMAEQFWRTFWRIHTSTGEVRSEELIVFVERVVAMAGGNRITPAELLSLLIHNGGGENVRSMSDGGDVFHSRSASGRRRQRVVEQVPGYEQRRMRYALDPRFQPVAEALRAMMLHAADNSERDQERSVGRRRMNNRVQRRAMAVVRRRIRLDTAAD